MKNTEIAKSRKTSKFYFQQNFFCGFSSRTVRNICEQVDNTEIQPEVYSRLAEDATYKVMEIVNVSFQSENLEKILNLFIN